MPGRWLAYRYGYNGMEIDPEVAGTGNHATTYFRQYDPRLGRWWSNDPITHSWESPYAAMGGNPIYFSDLSGATSDPPAGAGGTILNPDGVSPDAGPVEPNTDFLRTYGIPGTDETVTLLYNAEVTQGRYLYSAHTGFPGPTLDVGGEDITGFTLASGEGYVGVWQALGTGELQFQGFYSQQTGERYAPPAVAANTATISSPERTFAQGLRDAVHTLAPAAPAVAMLYDAADGLHLIHTRRSEGVAYRMTGEIENDKVVTEEGLKLIGLAQGGLAAVEGAAIRSAARAVSNPIPTRFARVFDAQFVNGPRLAAPNTNEAFVTAAEDISGITNSVGLAQRLTLVDQSGQLLTGPYAVVEFELPTLTGIASPVFRSNPGFVGGGLTAGGAREFVVPNYARADLLRVTVRIIR